MGHEPLTKWLVLLVTSLQFLTAYLLRHTSPLSLNFWLLAYLIGGTANQNLFLAIHEITHNLAFKSIRANRLLAIYANLPIGIPYAMLFKVCHAPYTIYQISADRLSDRNTTLKYVPSPVLSSPIDPDAFKASQILR